MRAALRPVAGSPPSAAERATSRGFRRDSRRGRARASLTRAHLEGFAEPWNYAGAEETEARLRAAGFAEARCWLQPWTVGPPEPLEFMRDRLPSAPQLDALPDGAPTTASSTTVLDAESGSR